MELCREKIYGSWRQKLAWLQHFLKARFNDKEKPRVTRKYKNARIENFALSNTTGQIDITIPVKESGNLGIGLSHFGAEASSRNHITERIDSVLLDDYVRTQQIERLDFIKCDVEGAELFVLQGAAASIDAHRPAIYLELNDRMTARLGYATSAVFAFLGDKGYDAFTLDAAGALHPVATVVSGADDYLFLHSQTPRAAAAMMQ